MTVPFVQLYSDFLITSAGKYQKSPNIFPGNGSVHDLSKTLYCLYLLLGVGRKEITIFNPSGNSFGFISILQTFVFS